MDRVAISVFDSNYFDYARRMFISLKAFHPALSLFAGDLGLSASERRLLEALGVTVLRCDRAEIVKSRGLHPTFGHFLLHSFLKTIPWKRVCWIDADTLILDDISELFSLDVDLVGHPGRSSEGPLYTLKEALPYYPVEAKDWLDHHLPCSLDNLYYSGGVWCTRSAALLELLDSLLDIIPSKIFPIEPPIFTAAIHHLELSHHQLDPEIWNFSRELLFEAKFRDRKVIYGPGIAPKTAAFSTTDQGTKACSNAVDQFYDLVVRKREWKKPLAPLINYIVEEGYTQTGPDKLRLLNKLVADTLSNDVPGDLVECGTWRGGTALVIINAAANSERKLHLFDTFEGMPSPSKEDYKGDNVYPGLMRGEGGSFGKGSLGDTSVGVVRTLFDRMGMDLERIIINKCEIGWPSKTSRFLSKLTQLARRLAGKSTGRARGILSKFPERISFLHIDVDFYEPYKWLLYHLYRRVPHGGVIVFDDYGYWIGAKRAVDEFLKESREMMQETGTTQRFVVKTQRAYVDLDDFCEEYMTAERWQLLHDLRAIYSDFKVTMFTIPGKSSPRWLRWVKSEFPWIEMAVHGTTHENQGEWLVSGEEALRKIEWVFNDQIYTRGFKAPWWKISAEADHALRTAGFWVATNKTNKFADPGNPLNYQYDTGDEVLPDIHYKHPFFDTWHGHVQSQKQYTHSNPNGLEDIFHLIADAWHSQARFGFISELFG